MAVGSSHTSAHLSPLSSGGRVMGRSERAGSLPSYSRLQPRACRQVRGQLEICHLAEIDAPLADCFRGKRKHPGTTVLGRKPAPAQTPTADFSPNPCYTPPISSTALSTAGPIRSGRHPRSETPSVLWFTALHWPPPFGVSRAGTPKHRRFYGSQCFTGPAHSERRSLPLRMLRRPPAFTRPGPP